MAFTENKEEEGMMSNRNQSGRQSGPGSDTGSGSSELGYDMNIVFRSHASNIPHITRWIDELVSMTERGSPMRKFPTTENLVDSLQRYDAVYRELLRQTSIFSEPVTKMLAKVRVPVHACCAIGALLCAVFYVPYVHTNPLQLHHIPPMRPPGLGRRAEAARLHGQVLPPLC